MTCYTKSENLKAREFLLALGYTYKTVEKDLYVCCSVCNEYPYATTSNDFWDFQGTYDEFHQFLKKNKLLLSQQNNE